MEIKVKEQDLKAAAAKGTGEFLDFVINSVKEAAGGELNADNMQSLNAQQTTLLAYDILRGEVMQGGFIQLIYNGYGEFFFRNPFSKVMRQWGLDDLAKMMNKCHKLYSEHHSEIERDRSDDDFMALYEQFPQFDTFDDDFVEEEQRWSDMVAYYVDDHLTDFIDIV